MSLSAGSASGCVYPPTIPRAAVLTAYLASRSHHGVLRIQTSTTASAESPADSTYQTALER
eukprot:4882591-Pleurochrysis_carterae.AAC.1